MIRLAPELEPMTRESRDLLSLFVRSTSIGPSAARAMQESPVTRFVRMPRYIAIGVVFDDGSATRHSLEGKRDLRGTRDPSRRSVEDPKGPADVARTALDAIAIELRQALVEAMAILSALDGLSAEARRPWHDAVAQELRGALPRLEALAYAGMDSVRTLVPREG
jgi:hypothetical protein